MQTSQRLDQQEAAERRRRELLEAANRVVLRDGPEASMNAIAAEAGITKPILYRHFGDKNGLYRALAQRHTDALLATLREALDQPGARETPVGQGKDVALAITDKGPYAVWTNSAGVELLRPAAKTTELLAAGGSFPTLIRLSNEAVLAAWEKDGQIEIARIN